MEAKSVPQATPLKNAFQIVFASRHQHVASLIMTVEVHFTESTENVFMYQDMKEEHVLEKRSILGIKIFSIDPSFFVKLIYSCISQKFRECWT